MGVMGREWGVCLSPQVLSSSRSSQILSSWAEGTAQADRNWKVWILGMKHDVFFLPVLVYRVFQFHTQIQHFVLPGNAHVNTDKAHWNSFEHEDIYHNNQNSFQVSNYLNAPGSSTTLKEDDATYWSLRPGLSTHLLNVRMTLDLVYKTNHSRCEDLAGCLLDKRQFQTFLCLVLHYFNDHHVWKAVQSI